VSARRTAPLAGLAACSRQHITARLDRRFYYHRDTRESQWEAPAGVDIQRSDDPRAADAYSSGPGAGAAPIKRGLSATDPSTILMTLGSFAVPISLVFGLLVYLYVAASREGLADALRHLKEKRDRIRKRKGTHGANAHE
jgi:hypothetical protein